MSEYRALYRKWRPVDFDDVSGQNAITDILKYEVKEGKLSHAYLFCGSRGTGKTSCAKILAKAVNCLNPKNGNPCNECEACRSIDAGIATDVIEMDAASNNGVDNVRDMKDEIAFTPAVLKYRVYIIDEVHMMSASAFNALLKTLEEPPSYVVFILATTEFHKLPTTIVSRCQRFDFRRISTEDIMARLKKIAAAEGIDLTEDGARVIARVARGGMRDAVSLLEQCGGTRMTVDAELVFSTVGGGNKDSAYRLVRAILDADYTTVYDTVNEIVMKSGDMSVFWQELIDAYRDIMVVKNTERAREFLDLTEAEYAELLPLSRELTPARLIYHVSLLEGAMADMQRAFNSKRSIAEIALTRMCDARTAITAEALALRVDELEKQVTMLKMGATGSPVAEGSVTVLPPKKETAGASAPTVAAKATEAKTDTKTDKSKNKSEQNAPAPEAKKTVRYASWAAVVERISEMKPSLSVQFQKSRAFVRPDGSYLICMNSFFAGRLASSENDLKILRGVIAEREGLDPAAVRIAIEPIDAASRGDLAEELAGIIDSI
ncbi:MAG: DNA polymerase III subunit gamma/tau [Clostridia bacterium]|nr:DNA polymerase III subunit gamma/tau [Clostridia bacterium]